MKGYSLALERPSAIYANNLLLEDRIDADAYNYSYIKEISKLKFSGLKLCNITDFYSIEMLTGFENSKYINYTSQGIPFIRCKNIRDNYFDEDDLTFISEEVYNILKRAQLCDDDLLYTKTGSNLGQVCCVPKGMRAIASSNCCFFKKRQNKSIDSHYVSTFLNSKYGKVQTNRAQTKTGQPTIDFQRLKQFLIPIPSPEIQKYIGDKVRKAEDLREEAKRLKKEAEEVLEVELGFKNLQEKLSVHKEKFSWVISKELGDRIDGEFYKTTFILNNEYIEILKHKGIKVLKLKDIIDKGSYGILPSSDDYGKGEVVLLRSTNLKEFLIDDSDVIKVPESYYKEKVQVKEGDILLEIKGQCYSGAIAEKLKDKTIVNGSIYKFSVKKEFNNYYILAYLLSESGQLQKQQNLANSIISYLSIDCINNLRIPILSNEKQRVIENKYKMYIEYVYNSKQLIQEAKKDVEDLIEGNFDISKIKANI